MGKYTLGQPKHKHVQDKSTREYEVLTEQHAALWERVSYLEQLIADSADKQSERERTHAQTREDQLKVQESLVIEFCLEAVKTTSGLSRLDMRTVPPTKSEPFF